MALTLADLARQSLRDAYAVQASDAAAKAHARRQLMARGHDEAAATLAVDAAFSRWFVVAEAS